MASRLRMDQYHHDTTTAFSIRNAPQPPSWADVGREATHPSARPVPPTLMQQWNPEATVWKQPESWSIYQQEPVAPPARPDEPDMFSNIGYWNGVTEGRQSNSQRSQRREQQPWERRQSPQQQQHQNQIQPPIDGPETPNTDVFSNVAMWDDREFLRLQEQKQQEQQQLQWKPPSKPGSVMSIDLLAPTPPPTFPALPISGSGRASSVESVSPHSFLSSEQPEEANTWKSFDMLLNQKPSRSPSIATTDGTKSPPIGHWLSNLP